MTVIVVSNVTYAVNSKLALYFVMVLVLLIMFFFFFCFLVIFNYQGIFMLVSGYFRLPHDIPKPVWRYPMSYISFHFWALQVLALVQTNF